MNILHVPRMQSELTVRMVEVSLDGPPVECKG